MRALWFLKLPYKGRWNVLPHTPHEKLKLGEGLWSEGPSGRTSHRVAQQKWIVQTEAKPPLDLKRVSLHHWRWVEVAGGHWRQWCPRGGVAASWLYFLTKTSFKVALICSTDGCDQPWLSWQVHPGGPACSVVVVASSIRISHGFVTSRESLAGTLTLFTWCSCTQGPGCWQMILMALWF